MYVRVDGDEVGITIGATGVPSRFTPDRAALPVGTLKGVCVGDDDSGGRPFIAAADGARRRAAGIPIGAGSGVG